MSDHLTHHDDCGCLRRSIAEMLRKESRRVELIAQGMNSDDLRLAMSARANAFRDAAHIVETME